MELGILTVSEMEYCVGEKLVEYQDIPPSAVYAMPLPDGLAAWFNAEGDVLFNESEQYIVGPLSWEDILEMQAA